MTTKQELTAKIAELQAQVDAMPEDKPANDLFTPEKNELFWTVQQNLMTGKFQSYRWRRTSNTPTHVFRTEQAANDFAEALNVVFECRAMSDWGENTVYIATVDWWADRHASLLFGKFATAESAQACVDKVGEARIQKTIKILFGVKS